MTRLKDHPTVPVFLLAVLCSLGSTCFPQSVEQSLHRQASLQGPPSWLFEQSAHKPISPRQAASSALTHLKENHVSDIVICEVTWIAAPLGGYLVDAKGRATIHGSQYTIFRVGVRDGTEQKGGKLLDGEPFVFIAFGKDKSGRTHWYPPPGPDVWPPRSEADSSILDYEFLINRARFETLDTLYR